MNGERLKICLLFVVILFSLFPVSIAGYPDYIFIEPNTPYSGFVEWNETISHRVFIDVYSVRTGFNLNITVIPNNTSNADIVLEYWGEGHKELKLSSDKKNYSKPENINIPFGPTGEIFFDVYTKNHVNTSYTILVKMSNIDYSPVYFILEIIGGFLLIIICLFVLNRYYDSIYNKISEWRFRRKYKKVYGREYDENDIGNYPIATQRTEQANQRIRTMNGGVRTPVYSVNIEKKARIKIGAKIVLILGVVASLCTIFRVDIWDFIDFLGRFF